MNTGASARTALLLALALAACGAPPPSVDAPAGTIVVHAERLAVHSGQVGMIDPRPGTYVLVDVDNKNVDDYVVTLDGTIKNAAGADVPLAFDEMPVPAGSTRTFALVAAQDVVGPGAAQVRVVRAKRNTYPAPIAVDKIKVSEESGTLVVTAEIRSLQKRDGVANVIAAFHDEAGRPLTRPFTRVVLAPQATVPVTFRGPAGAKAGTVFVGESVF